MDITITINETDAKILENDLLDVLEWAEGMVSGKVNECWKRFQREWTTKLLDDPDFTDPIPSNKEDFVALITSRDDYQNRIEREAEAASEE